MSQIDNGHDPTGTEELKQRGEEVREELDGFLGTEETVSGKLEAKLGTDGESIGRSNKEFAPTTKHLEEAANLTGTAKFNIQNKVLMFLGHSLALLLLIPVASYIMIFDMRNISQEFVTLYNTYTFTTILVIGAISFIIVGLTDYLFLGQFNKKNKETKELERIILIFLLMLQFGSHAYFAYLNVGVQNVVKRENTMTSATSTEGIRSSGINDSISIVKSQIESLKDELKEKSASYKIEETNKQSAHKEWEKLNRLSNPSRKQARKRMNYYTQENKAQATMDEISNRKSAINRELTALGEKQIGLSDSLSSISVNLDKELQESGFWKIIYLLVLLAMFEGLSHIHWLAYYRIIKNAPPDQVEDWRGLSHVLNFGKAASTKIDEIIGVVGGQQMRMVDQKINDLKMVSKGFEYVQATGTVGMIEQTKSSVATMGVAVAGMRENTKGVVHLAQTIKKEGLGSKLGYEEREDGNKVRKLVFNLPPKFLESSLNWLVEEFRPLTAPTLLMSAGEDGGYCDPLADTIVIGENEREKLTVLAHEFCHHLGYIQHDKEFRELEASIIKGLELWLSQQKHK